MSDVLAEVRAILGERGEALGLADEGGYGLRLPSNEEGLNLLTEPALRAGYHAGEEVSFGLDAATSHFYRDGLYHLAAARRALTGQKMVEYLEALFTRHPVVSLEDGLAEEDWQAWTEVTGRPGGRIQILGDDLFATRVERIRRRVEQRAANAVLIKMNPVRRVSPVGGDRGHEYRALGGGGRSRATQGRFAPAFLLRIEAQLGNRGPLAEGLSLPIQPMMEGLVYAEEAHGKGGSGDGSGVRDRCGRRPSPLGRRGIRSGRRP